MKQAAPGAALICLLWLCGLGPAAAQYVPTLTVVRSVDSFHVLQNGEFTHLLERDLRIDTQQLSPAWAAAAPGTHDPSTMPSAPWSTHCTGRCLRFLTIRGARKAAMSVNISLSMLPVRSALSHATSWPVNDDFIYCVELASFTSALRTPT